LSNPHCTQFAKDALKMANDLYNAGFALDARATPKEFGHRLAARPECEPRLPQYTAQSESETVLSGKALQGEMTIEDPMTFVQPWKVTSWEKVTTQPQGGDVAGTFNEEIRCVDGEMVNPLNQAYASKLERCRPQAEPISELVHGRAVTRIAWPWRVARWDHHCALPDRA
jgi:hypothetical protein